MWIRVKSEFDWGVSLVKARVLEEGTQKCLRLGKVRLFLQAALVGIGRLKEASIMTEENEMKGFEVKFNFKAVAQREKLSGCKEDHIQASHRGQGKTTSSA